MSSLCYVNILTVLFRVDKVTGDIVFTSGGLFI